MGQERIYFYAIDRTPNKEEFSDPTKFFERQFSFYEPEIAFSKQFFISKKIKTISIEHIVAPEPGTSDGVYFIELSKEGGVIKKGYRNSFGYDIMFEQYWNGRDSIKVISYSKNGTFARIDSSFHLQSKDKYKKEFHLHYTKSYRKGYLLNEQYHYYNIKYFNQYFDHLLFTYNRTKRSSLHKILSDNRITFLSKKFKLIYQDSLLYFTHCDLSENHFKDISNFDHLLSKKTLIAIKKNIGTPFSLPLFEEPWPISSGLESESSCGYSRANAGLLDQIPGPIHKFYNWNLNAVDDTLFSEYYPLNTDKFHTKPNHPNCTHYLHGWSCTPIRRIKSILHYTYFPE